MNRQDKRGRTTLSWAAGDGLDDMVKLLLKVPKVDVNLQDNQGRSPLSWAAGNGCIAVVRTLLQDKRTTKGIVDNNGRNEISWACGGGHTDVLRMLLKHHCPGTEVKDADGWTPLAWAIETNSPSVVERLVATGSVDLEQGDKTGRTALCWAVEYGHAEVVRVLLRAGANPCSKSQWGYTPLSTAEKFGRDDIKTDLLLYMENMRSPGQEDIPFTESVGWVGRQCKCAILKFPVIDSFGKRFQTEILNPLDNRHAAPDSHTSPMMVTKSCKQDETEGEVVWNSVGR